MIPSPMNFVDGPSYLSIVEINPRKQSLRIVETSSTSIFSGEGGEADDVGEQDCDQTPPRFQSVSCVEYLPGELGGM